MKKIKVLHIGMSPNIGGLESFSINMHRNIDRNLIQFDFINIYNNKIAFEEEHIKLGSKIHYITARKKNPIKSYIQLKDVIKYGNYDYIHFHCMTYCWPEPIIIANKYSKGKLVVHSHLTGFNSNTSLKEKILHNIGKFRIRKMKFLKISCGDDAGKWLFGSQNYEIIENGIDINKYSYNEEIRQKIRKKYSFSNDDIVIGHVGNFSYQKNYPCLIRTFYELHKKNDNFKLLLIGNLDYAEDTINLVNSLGLGDSVKFTGLINNVNECYSGMDMFMFPSFYEGFSISMIEAQASGLICFSSNTLDSKTNVGGKVITINISKSVQDISEIILSKFKIGYERKNIKIDLKYSCQNSSKKLEEFYKNNREKEN